MRPLNFTVRHPMRAIPFVECIAERKLLLRRPAGPLVEVTLEIGRPVPLP
jgi:hypothetical protein